MLKSLIVLVGILAAGPSAPLDAPDKDAHTIIDESKCNHPALQIQGFKLISYMADFRNDFAAATYWKELPNGKIQRALVSRKDCTAPWDLTALDIINPYGEKL